MRGMQGETGRRRALSHVGGPARARGEPEAAARLERIVTGVEEVPADRLTHPFHAWPGRLHPEIARRVLAGSAALPRGRPGRVLDPFCGGGTTGVEAFAAGHAAVGVDLNPVALLVGRARSTLLDGAGRAAFVERARAIAGEVFGRARRREPVRLSSAARSQGRWYGPHVLLELQGLADGAREEPDEVLRTLLRAVLSSILVKVSLQRADSREEGVPRQVGRGTASTLFARRAEELAVRLAALEAEVPSGTPPPAWITGDARDLPEGARGPFDLVLTSPPYPGTFDYLAHQARRLPWLGFGPGAGEFADRGEIGARRRQGEGALAAWEADLRAWLVSVRRALRPGGEAYLVVGDGLLEGRPWLAAEAVRVAALDTGLVPVAVVSQERPHFHPASRAAYAGRPREEHLVWLVR